MTRPRILLLNGSYEPLTIVGWRKAITLVLADTVDVVETYSEPILSPGKAWASPAVIRLRQYINLGWLPVPFSRQNVFARDGHRCQYCQQPFHSRDLTLDHVMPRARGGHKTWDNVVASCGPCNRRKRDRTPKEAGMKLSKPICEPRWAQLVRGELIPEDRPQEWEPWLRVA